MCVKTGVRYAWCVCGFVEFFLLLSMTYSIAFRSSRARQKSSFIETVCSKRMKKEKIMKNVVQFPITAIARTKRMNYEKKNELNPNWRTLMKNVHGLDSSFDSNYIAVSFVLSLYLSSIHSDTFCYYYYGLEISTWFRCEEEANQNTIIISKRNNRKKTER